MKTTAGKFIVSAAMFVGTVLLTAALSGGGTYIFTHRGSVKEMQKLDTRISELQSELLSGTLEFTTEALESSPTITYIHPMMGYSLTLPAGVVGIDRYDCEGGCGSILNFAYKIAEGSYDDSYVTLYYYKWSKSLSKAVDDFRSGNDGIFDESNAQVNGVAARRFYLGGLAEGRGYIAVANGYRLRIEQYPSNAKNQKIVDSILTTFRFSQ